MDIFAKRSDWLLHVGRLQPLDIVTIHPLDGLTGEMVVKAMGAQGLLKNRPSYVVRQHGTKIFVQREAGSTTADPAPAYLLSDAQWRKLWDLFFGEFIVKRFESTMRVLQRKHLVSRRTEYSRWELTAHGRNALRTAPRAYRVE